MYRLLVAILCLSPSAMLADESDRSMIGEQVADFTLKTHLGNEVSLSDFRESKHVVLVFLGTECPLVKLYAKRLGELNRQYREKGVTLLGINSNTQDSLTEIAAYANRHDISFPVLKDLANRVADQLNAKRTPEVFVLDADRRIRYHGRIDDQYLVGLIRDEADRFDLRMALDELIAGKQVSVAETESIGCHIGRVKTVEASGDVTYSRDIAPILNARCVECHREGEIAPFSLTKYEDLIGWEDTIIEVIEDRRMPPWFAAPEHGQFANDARLTEQEKS